MNEVFLKDLNLKIKKLPKPKSNIYYFNLNIESNNHMSLYLCVDEDDIISTEIFQYLKNNNLLTDIYFKKDYFGEKYIDIYNPSIMLDDEHMFYLKLKYSDIMNGDSK